MRPNLEDIRTYQRADEFGRIFRAAVVKAQSESRQLGVPNVYSINGQHYYELPGGEYTRTPPEHLMKEQT